MARAAFFRSHSGHRSIDDISRRDALKDAALGMAAMAGGVLGAGTAKADTVTMRFGSDSPIGAPHTKTAVVMKLLVEARTSGRVQVTIFPDGQLGDGGAMLNSIKTGSLDALTVDAGHITIAVPEVDVFSLPFLFKGIQQSIAFVNSPVGLKLWPKINEAFGCEVLGWAADGSSDFLNNKRQIRTPADVVGLRVGLSTPSKVQRDFILALGGIPTVMETHALYTSLETRLIDAVARNPVDIVQFRLHQVTKYLSLTRHLSQPVGTVVSKKFMAKLSPQDREIVRAAAKLAVKAHVAASLNGEKTNLTFLQEHGIQVTPVNVKPFADKMEVVYKEQADRIGADIIDAARRFAAA